MLNDASNLPDDPAVLKAMIATLQAENAKISATLRVHDQLVQALRLRIAKLQKLAFGKSSEKIEREIPSWDIALQCPAGQWSNWSWRSKTCWLPWPKTMTRPLMKGWTNRHQRSLLRPLCAAARVCLMRPCVNGGSLILAHAVPTVVAICAWWARMSASFLT
jgi:hypothetical protein